MVIALSAGDCAVCLQPYRRGAEVGLVAEGWAHLACYRLTLAPWTAALEIVRNES